MTARDGASGSLLDILSMTAIALALIPLVGLPLFWLFDLALHALLGVPGNPNNRSVPWADMLSPMYLGLGPPAGVTGLVVGAWRARTGRASPAIAAVAGAVAIAIALLVMMTLWPDNEPPELPFRAMEAALMAAFTLTSAALAAAIGAIDRSRFSPPRL